MSSTQNRCSYCAVCAQCQNNVSHVQNVTAEKADQITHTGPEILRKEDVILELLNQRAALNRRLNAFVPVVALPPELLTIIFEFACWSSNDQISTTNLAEEHSEESWNENSDESSGKVPDESLNGDLDNTCAETLLLIAQICSAWRNIALSTPHLWTNITLYIENKRATQQAAKLQYWLSKSGQCPLNVRLVQQSGYHCESIKSTTVIDILMAYTHRFHALNLPLPKLWEPALNRAADCVPLLTSLTIRFPGGDEDSFPDRINMFANAPQLREVTIDYSTTDILLPWAQLESLDSQVDDETELVETLRLCSRLRHCIVGFPSWRPRMSIYPSPLMAHTALEELDIFGDNVDGTLFQTLELPVLRSFTLNSEPLKWSLQLQGFLERVRGTLETLKLSHGMFEEEQLLAALRAVPRLRKLKMFNWYEDRKPKALTQRVLDLMNPNKYYEELRCQGIGLSDGTGGGDAAGMLGQDERSNRHCLVPNLETLQYHGEIGFTSHALVEFLVTQSRGPSSCTEFDGPGMQTASEPAPAKLNRLPARLCSAIFKTPTRIQFEDADIAIIQRLQLEGIHLVFLKISEGGWQGNF